MKRVRQQSAMAMLLTFTMVLSGCAGGTSSQVEDASSAQVTGGVAFPEEMYDAERMMEIEQALGEQMVPLSGNPADAIFQAPQASGKVVYSGAGSKDAVLDASNAKDGYVMAKYSGTSKAKFKVIVTGPSGINYTYDMNNQGKYETFVLSDGNGQYNIGIYENVGGTKYTPLLSQKISVTLKDQYAPFLRPNQYVNYNANSEVVKVAKKIAGGESNTLKKVEIVYDYVVNNIKYDKKKAQTVQSGYLPVVDEILKGKTGICFDYASVMAAMLRSQGVPTKLVTGYTGTAYHAWISTYSPETGWVEGVIFFDGKTWKLMDPTFASSSKSSDSIMEYIGDGKNYKQKYLY